MRKRLRKAGPIGLDIGTTHVRALQLCDVEGTPAVQAACERAIDRDHATPEDRKTALHAAVESVLRSGPFVGSDVVSALGASDVQLKNLRLPKLPASELEQAVQFEAISRFEIEPDAARIQYVPVGEVRHGNELKEEVIAFAAANDVVDARLELLDSLKLTPVAIDLAPCAVARSFVRFLRRTEDENSVNVFLEIGYHSTAIIITRGAEISFIKIVEIAGEHFNEAVARALDVSRDEAADMRVRMMQSRRKGGALETGAAAQEGGDAGWDADARGYQDMPPEIASAVNDAIRPLVERLCRDVQLCLRYFAVTFRGGRPESLTVVGGEAAEPCVVALLSELIDVPCTVGHPLRGILGLERLGGRDRRVFQAAWAVAGGLALRDSVWVGGRRDQGPAWRRALRLQRV